MYLPEEWTKYNIISKERPFSVSLQVHGQIFVDFFIFFFFFSGSVIQQYSAFSPLFKIDRRYVMQEI